MAEHSSADPYRGIGRDPYDFRAGPRGLAAQIESALEEAFDAIPATLRDELDGVAETVKALAEEEARRARTTEAALAALKTAIARVEAKPDPAPPKPDNRAVQALTYVARDLAALQSAVAELKTALAAPRPAAPAPPAPPVHAWRVQLDRDINGRSTGTATITAAE